jgi:glycerol-3-phosphate dehydrogenase (NAD(P)+)
MNICILGAGAWGTAMAIHLARQQHTVTLVTRRLEHAMAMASEHENCDYLPGMHLDDNIQIASEVKPSMLEADVVLMACPSHGLRYWCEEVKNHLDSSWRIKLIITLCKGLERGTHLVPSDVVKDVLPGIPVGVLSGPNYAMEVAQGKLRRQF